MRKLSTFLLVVVTILGLHAGGCAVDLVATRPGDRLEVHVKPVAPKTDAPGVPQDKPSTAAAGETA